MTDPTPAPTYEGRRLPRPHDEVVDQGFAFDLGTLDRRGFLRGFGVGAGVLALAACGDGGAGGGASTSGATTTGATSATGEIPDETAGPYPGDGSNGPDVLTRSGVVRSDIRSSFGGATGTAAGIPMTLHLTITNLAKNGAGYAGAAVYVWHCTRDGEYSMYSQGITDQNYLRGVQIADASGKVTFTSILPACYSGRWPHIHFEVYPDQASITDSTKAVATSQVALPKAVCDQAYATAGYEKSVTNLSKLTLATDNVFGDDSAATQLATVTGDASKGYTVKLTAAVDPRTQPTGGGAPPAGGAAPSGPPPGGAPSR